MRRVVTGHTPDGKAVPVSDTEVEPILPSLGIRVLWGPMNLRSHILPTSQLLADSGSGHLPFNRNLSCNRRTKT